MSSKVQRYDLDYNQPCMVSDNFGPYVKASDYDALVDLLRHCQIHSGYRNCGYNQMTTEQKQLYDSLARPGRREEMRG